MRAVWGHLLDEQLSQRPLELQELSSALEVLGSLGLTCSLRLPQDVDGAVVRSQLQIELILRSLSPSLAKRQVKALL